MKTQLDIIKRYRKEGFSLTLWDTGKRDGRGQTRLGYRLKDQGKLIFEGEDFAGSPLHADDSLETVASLLCFLSLRPGDTDREYFDNYTPAQMEWCESSRAEHLSLIQYDLSERLAKKVRS